jgi:hypothetical protein
MINFLGDPENPIESDDLAGFIDSLVPWMQSSNFKVRTLDLGRPEAVFTLAKGSAKLS